MKQTLSLVALLLVGGCAATHEAALNADLATARRTLAPPGEAAAEPPDGALASYVAYAMASSPELRARYERWRAATLRIARARALPEPMIMYALYAVPVQTRVGPQRHRLSARQDFPWPTRLSRAADAQSSRALAAQHRFEASALAIAARVADAWWRLWLVRRVEVIEREQLTFLDGLRETQRARLETGGATLADVAQIDLAHARASDAIEGLREQERSAEAALRAALGARGALALPSGEAPGVALVGEAPDALAEAVRAHPYLRSFERMAEAEEAEAAAREADRLPRFSLGVDWIETGEAMMPVQGSGDDAVIVSVGLTVPLWQDAYEGAQRAAEADAEAERAEGRSAEDAALAELAQALSAVRDSHRRVGLYRDTLLPQAQSAYESVIGAYAAGRTTVAASLLAQRDLLELALALERARADHGRAWARLERVVGRPVRAAAAADSGSESNSMDTGRSGAARPLGGLKPGVGGGWGLEEERFASRSEKRTARSRSAASESPR